MKNAPPPFVPAAPKSTEVSVEVLVTAVGVTKLLPSKVSPPNWNATATATLFLHLLICRMMFQ